MESYKKKENFINLLCSRITIAVKDMESKAKPRPRT